MMQSHLASCFIVMMGTLIGCSQHDQDHTNARTGTNIPISTNPSVPGTANSAGIPAAGADPIATGIQLLEQSNMPSELTYISSDAFNGRLSGTPENTRAAQWLSTQLNSLNIPPARANSYEQTFILSEGPTTGQQTANIVAMLPGQDPVLKNQYVIMGAHMDHTGTLSFGFTCDRSATELRAICNGADDNASGTIALLNIAKALAAVRHTLKRSVVFIWFSGEEIDLLGSDYYVNSDPIFPIAQTTYMINLDMVGYLSQNDNQLLALGGATSPAGAEVLRQLGAKYPGKEIVITNSAGGGSDHAHFMARGIPGVFLHTGVDSNPNYHKTSDTSEKIDYAGMKVVAKVAFELAWHAANQLELAKSLTLREEPFVTPEELEQSCHHLIKNPFTKKVYNDHIRFE